MSRHEWISLALAVVFGLVGAWLFETFGDIGEWLANFCAIPPTVYYLVFVQGIFKGRLG